MQIASDRMAFIFDLIKLHEDEPDALDSCLTRIMQSSRVLKLGMKIDIVNEYIPCKYMSGGFPIIIGYAG